MSLNVVLDVEAVNLYSKELDSMADETGLENHHPYGRIVLKLLREPTLEPDLYNFIVEQFASKRRQGVSLKDTVFEVLLEASETNPVVSKLAANLWFWNEYLNQDPDTYDTFMDEEYGSDWYGYMWYLNKYCFGSLVSSETWRNDPTFLFRALEKDATLLFLLPGNLKANKELQLTAFSGPRRRIEILLSGFGDNYKRFKVDPQFQANLRKQLDTHYAFCQIFLFAWTDKRGRGRKKVSNIRFLMQGYETSTAYKKLIAEFVGLPLGKELQLIRRAEDNLDALYHLLSSDTNHLDAPLPVRRGTKSNVLTVETQELVLGGIGHVFESPQAPINRRCPRRRCRR